MKGPEKGFSRELQVGFFVFIALLVVAAFSFKITETPVFFSGTRITTYLEDATGLFKKSKVKMAGIDIGLVTDIELEDGRAKITLTIQRKIEIPQGARVVARPLGILGDKYLEVVLPPREGEGDEENRTPQSLLIEGAWKLWSEIFPAAQAQSSNRRSQTRLGEGDVIPADNSGATLDDLTRQLGEVTGDLKSISQSLKNMVEGKDTTTPLGKTIVNTEELTNNLNVLVKENQKDFRQVMKSLARVSKSLEELTNSQSKDGMSQDIQSLARAADRLANTVNNIESITGKINRGEGTLGRLVNDPVTASEFNKALITVNAALDRAERTRVFVEAMPQMNLESQDVKTYVGMRLAPRDNTSYIGQLVVTPEGRTKTKITRTRVNGGPETVTEEVEQDPSALAFSVQYAKRFWNTSFRVGLFESTGGLALDQSVWKDSIRLSAEIFDFDSTRKPNLKFTASYKILEIFQFQAGVERSLSSQAYAFIGFGLSFSDEDLKTVLLLPGVP
jgi:phospholipid/cholesterol/gamma-HCH transport system substrate-binding protein